MATGPDTSATAQDLLIRLAESAGCAVYENPEDANDNTARIPTNPHDLDKCWRALNDAISYLSRVRTWRCLMYRSQISIGSDGTAPLCLDSRPGVYALPWYFDTASPAVDWHISDSAGSLVSIVTMTDINTVRRHLLAGTGSGRPVLAAVVPGVSGSPGASSRKGWQIHLAPIPDQSYTMESEIRLRATKMVSLEDRHVFGAIHDETLLSVAKWMIARDQRSDAENVALLKAEADEAIATSIRIDIENTPPTLGLMTDPGVCHNEYAMGDRYGLVLYGTTIH